MAMRAGPWNSSLTTVVGHHRGRQTALDDLHSSVNLRRSFLSSLSTDETASSFDRQRTGQGHPAGAARGFVTACAWRTGSKACAQRASRPRLVDPALGRPSPAKAERAMLPPRSMRIAHGAENILHIIGSGQCLWHRRKIRPLGGPARTNGMLAQGGLPRQREPPSRAKIC